MWGAVVQVLKGQGCLQPSTSGWHSRHAAAVLELWKSPRKQHLKAAPEHQRLFERLSVCVSAAPVCKQRLQTGAADTRRCWEAKHLLSEARPQEVSQEAHIVPNTQLAPRPSTLREWKVASQGFEPTTSKLTAWRSATELQKQELLGRIEQFSQYCYPIPVSYTHLTLPTILLV